MNPLDRFRLAIVEIVDHLIWTANDNFTTLPTRLFFAMLVDDFNFDIVVDHFSAHCGALLRLWTEVTTLEDQATGLGASIARRNDWILLVLELVVGTEPLTNLVVHYRRQNSAASSNAFQKGHIVRGKVGLNRQLDQGGHVEEYAQCAILRFWMGS